MSKVLVIHTVRSLVEYFERKLRGAIPSADFFHILDEALVERIRLRGSISAEDTRRLESHFAMGCDIGVTAVLVTCSTLSPCVAQIAASGRLRIIAIDDALADAIAACQESIIVLATNPMTVEPTRQTLAARGIDPREGRTVAIGVIAGAFAALQDGDPTTHDEIVAASVIEHLNHYDRVALAQASMARATELLNEVARERVLTSPELAIARLARVLQDVDAIRLNSTP